ncbi:MAG: RagB/SusD family nutrient uptake outer membrane protein [Bacteroidia bacterium]|nr:RagB/SusD family nutrient uptake outer membrane protein [Bacteroidia bacterium]
MTRLRIYLITSFVFISSVFWGCNGDLLNQVNTNTVSTGTFWKDEGDVSLAVNGMYHPITNTFFWGRIIHTGAILRSDVFNIRPFGPNTAMSTFQGGPGAARWATEIWQEPFKAIFRANAVLENVNSDNVPDQTVRDGYLGQAYFMRAFSYWYLLNLFGNVPLITETAKGSEDFFPNQASAADVWKQIEADFAEAANRLPASWSDGDRGRPTSGSARAFLGKSQLYQGKWSDAETSFDQVIQSGNYSLLPASRYEENFSESNENNEESVYELQFVGQSAFAWGVDIPMTGNMGNFHIDYAPPSKSPDQSHYINTWVKELFEMNGDTIRRNATLAYDYPGSTGYGGVPFAEDFAAEIELAATEGMEAIYSRKYAGMDIGKRDDVDFLGTNVGNNWRIIRYADVLLMMAEALNEQGKTSEAESFLNQVRNRANVESKTGLDQNAMRQAIIEERVLELTGESHRFFDLVRWELADDYLGENSLHGSNPKSLSGGVFQSGKHELVWIPVSETSANTNLVQNPGYGR